MMPSFLTLATLWSDNDSGFTHGWMLLAAAFVIFLQRFPQQNSLQNTENTSLIKQTSTQAFPNKRRYFLQHQKLCLFSATLSGLILTSLWCIAYVLGIQSVHQILAFGILFCIAWGAMGFYKAMQLLLPFTVLAWAFPLWTVINPLLQSMAAWANQFLLALFNIPAMIEGIMVRIPGGIFEIADGCSGIRYLMVAAALAHLYSLLYFRTLKASLLLLLFSIGLAILFNWIRIFIIIYVGFESDMQHPWIKDHGDIGWYLFVGVLIPLFMMGRWVETSTINQQSINQQSKRSDTTGSNIQTKAFSTSTLPRLILITTACCALPVIVFLWQAMIKPVSHYNELADQFSVVSKEGLRSYKTLSAPDHLWKPYYPKADIQINKLYQSKSSFLLYHVTHFFKQDTTHELISETNQFTQKPWTEKFWSPENKSNISGHFTIVQRNSNGAVQEQMNQWLTLSWYGVGGEMAPTAGAARKLRFSAFIQGRADASLYALAIPCSYRCSNTEAQQLLAIKDSQFK